MANGDGDDAEKRQQRMKNQAEHAISLVLFRHDRLRGSHHVLTRSLTNVVFTRAENKLGPMLAG